ncbi:hypothetical protein ACFYMO_04010 [Streptomyces sp. NPDC007025]|uniref:hypothetical protein n=1 Tax=Streptomyces sp. NPDC007025 TaxID=3364771 RepID=UPI0036A22F12
MTGISPQQLAAAIRGAAVEAGQTAPVVRGADWRLATVTTVNSDGTVDCDEIRARRLPSYPAPQTGDVIVVTRSSSGNWAALGRLESSGAGWTSLTLASGYVWPGHGYSPAYLVQGRQVTFRGRVGPSSGTIANGSTIATIPTAIRPPAGVEAGFGVARDSTINPAVVRAEITDSGILRIYETTSQPSWIALDGITYWTI